MEIKPRHQNLFHDSVENYLSREMTMIEIRLGPNWLEPSLRQYRMSGKGLQRIWERWGSRHKTTVIVRQRDLTIAVRSSQAIPACIDCTLIIYWVRVRPRSIRWFPSVLSSFCRLRRDGWLQVTCNGHFVQEVDESIGDKVDWNQYQWRFCCFSE